MGKERTPFFVIAVVLIALVVAIEVGSRWFVHAATSNAYATPGLGIRYLALLDGFLLFTAAFLALEHASATFGLAQGCVTVIVSFCLVIGGIVLAFFAFQALVLMVTMLLAAPFGTIAYMALFGTFPSGPANATIAIIMLLTLGFAVCLVLAQQDNLKAKSLVFLTLTALLATFVLRLLLTIVPGFLDSITDAVGALIIAILAILWALFILIFSLVPTIRAAPALIKVLKGDHAPT